MLYIITTVGSLLLGLLLGVVLIPALRALKAGQSIREVGPTWHQSKAGTPTMGGWIFILASLFCIPMAWGQMRQGSYTHLALFGFALVYGLIGFLDDYVGIHKHRNMGLTSWQKLALQLATAACYLALLRWSGHLSSTLYVPFFNTAVTISWPVFLVFAMFVIVGCVNAVNLTDGVDGLASGVTLPVLLFFGLAALHWGKYDIALFAFALLGGLAAFLCYNFHPAKVFMGDTGSLFLGGAVCGLAFALDMPLALIPVGIIYIAEALSDIIQVGYFKLSHGKRVFRMAPLHHHLELGGWSEVKIFTVFTSITVLMCALTLWGVWAR